MGIDHSPHPPIPLPIGISIKIPIITAALILRNTVILLLLYCALCCVWSLRNDSSNEARLSRTGNKNGGQRDFSLRYFLDSTNTDVNGIRHVVFRIRQTTPGSAARYIRSVMLVRINVTGCLSVISPELIFWLGLGLGIESGLRLGSGLG